MFLNMMGKGENNDNYNAFYCMKYKFHLLNALDLSSVYVFHIKSLRI